MIFDRIKPLDGADADRSRNERIFDKLAMDLCGVEPGESFLETVALFDGSIGEHPCRPFVRAFFWHQGINAAILVKGAPFAEGLGAVLEEGVVRECQWLFRHTAVIRVPGSIRKRPWITGAIRARRNCAVCAASESNCFLIFA